MFKLELTLTSINIGHPSGLTPLGLGCTKLSQPPHGGEESRHIVVEKMVDVLQVISDRLIELKLCLRYHLTIADQLEEDHLCFGVS